MGKHHRSHRRGNTARGFVSERLSNTEIYPLTWNFASPDGPAAFHLDKMNDGEPLLVWRRIGGDAIYKNR